MFNNCTLLYNPVTTVIMPIPWVIIFMASFMLFNSGALVTARTKGTLRSENNVRGSNSKFRVLVAYEASSGTGAPWTLADITVRDALSMLNEVFHRRKLHVKYDVKKLNHGEFLSSSMKTLRKSTAKNLMVSFVRKTHRFKETLKKGKFDSIQFITAKNHPGNFEERVRNFTYGTVCLRYSFGLVMNPRSKNALADGIFHNLICTLAVVKQAKCYAESRDVKHLYSVDSRGDMRRYLNTRYLSRQNIVNNWTHRNSTELCRRNRAKKVFAKFHDPHSTAPDNDGMPGFLLILVIVGGALVLIVATFCGVYCWKKDHDKSKLLRNRLSVKVKSGRDSLSAQYSLITDPNINFP